MSPGSESHYEGWLLHTMCQENKPDDWRPGDEIPYLAWAQARFMQPHVFQGEWTATAPIRVPLEGMMETNEPYKIHDAMKAKLVEQIDSRKIPA